MIACRRWWGAVLAACLLPSVFVGIAAAASPGSPRAGYWWVPEPVSGLIPVPGVPANGLYVASSPSGPQAESAIRFSVVDQIAYIRLTLHVSNQERVGTPAVLAYPATSSWQTGGPQSWSARPSYRATATPVKGMFSDGGTRMTLVFPAEQAQQGIVLVPDPRAGSSTYSVAFAPPATADIKVTAAPRPSIDATHGQVPPSHHPTAHASPHSARTSASPTSHPVGHPRTSPAPKPATSRPPRSTHGSVSPTPSAQPEDVADHDHQVRDVIIIVAIVAGALLLLGVWRTARRG